jgi:AbrB family looped-hinge helix DNA binding protein
MPENAVSSEIQLGPQGGVVIPAALRKALHLQPGDRLIACLEGDARVLARREAIGKRLQGRFRHLPAHVSLADELIAQGRVDAANKADTR